MVPRIDMSCPRALVSATQAAALSTETARRYRIGQEINLYTACRAPHDEWTQKFNRKKFTHDVRTICWTKQRRNTAPTDKFDGNSLSLLHRLGK